ncbi:GNAT family N-acetyltransferase [Synergistaceae bacterium OttesenSCG-928-I11]|nr:GNAT family N-acetyltransferase [Synergistaceae bacterium OttesenSCG-928-I11]
MSEYRFRPATTDDLPILKGIARDVIESCYASFLSREAIRGYIDSGQSDREIEDGVSGCVVMLDGDERIGFAITKESTLHLLMIAPARQNQGCGSELLRHVEDGLFDRYETIYLQSFARNCPANRFYEKNGWMTVREEYLPEMGLEMLFFEKTIAATERS